MDAFLAAAPPGLEAVVAGELAALGLIPRAAYLKPGAAEAGVPFSGGAEAMYRACLQLRSAERVLMLLGRFPAKTFAALEDGARALPWSRVRGAGETSVKARCRASKLYHERAVAERLERFAPPGARVLAFMEKDECRVFVDAGGEPLHRRGYRLETAKAPLRETLAAALLLSSGWDGRAPLLDPLCGSGTIAIEAALLARGLAPGARRRFAFMDWPGFDAALWARLCAAAPRPAPPILASDRDAGAIEAARANAARAGVAQDIEFSVRALSAIEPPPGPGWLVTNPPYGGRVAGGRDVRDLYAQLGKVFRAKLGGWKAAMITTTLPLARSTGLPFSPGPSTKNGGIDARFFTL